MGAGIYIENSYNINFTDLEFYNNTSLFKGVVFILRANDISL